MSRFHSNLRQYREKLGINAKDLAAQIGIKYSTYSNYENQGREPNYDTLIKIAATLHVSIDDLLNYERPVLSIEEWITRLDNGGVEKLTSMEQLELKSMLLELQKRRESVTEN